MVYTVTFNPAIDYVVRMESFTAGAVNRTAGELIQYGGKGINVSVMLRRLGVANTALGFVAGFTGRAVEEGLRTEGVNADFIRLSGGLTRINIKMMADKESEINGRGPDIDQAALAALYAKLEDLTAGDYLVLAGSVPASLPADIYRRILERLRGRGIQAVVDAEGGLLRETLAYRPFLVKPNSVELGAMFDARLETDGQIEDCAGRLRQMGARNILVSRAARGAILLDETGLVHKITAPKGQVKNSVGAGDSMAAGFLAGWLETGDYAAALRMGTAAGSATAFSDGLAEREQVEKLLEMNYEAFPSPSAD
ncbi:MAG: 1-phosphofructokinase [Clostridiales bacterium]|nr:1-phosphofructokinase [Clostridiales bacterium]